LQPPAISVRQLTVRIGGPGSATTLLDDVSFTVPKGSFAAIIGPSGCGKTTLLRAVAGLVRPTVGEISLLGHPLAVYKQRFPMALGYLPQFSEAHADLTVAEILTFASQLQLPAAVTPATRNKWLDYLIDLAGLQDVREQRFKTLSGGQRRRLALAETLMADPPILIVDELTSGLDPQAETSMMQWLQFLADERGKTILLVTHAVRNLDLTDSVMLMKRGRIVLQGSYEKLHQAAGVETIEQLFEKQDAELIAEVPVAGESAASVGPQEMHTGGPPSAWRQFLTLVRRQWLLFARDGGQMALHAAILFTFPALVAVFAVGGLPQVRNLSLHLDTNIIRSLQEQLLVLGDSLSTATLVSGLIMFQVILLTLAGANNGSREIAKERSILEKEKRSGLSPLAYVSSKLLTVTVFTLAQAFWMTWFVKTICKFPGEFPVQFIVLYLATLAMGATCLAISACSRSTEKASLLAIYLVGLQLPLSGAVLALPKWLVWITRPFIAAYWGWSGYLKSLSNHPIYDVVRQTTHTWLATPEIVCAVLIGHIVIATGICIYVVGRQRASA
jgi:ABC-type multidrug transport system ATPase subunit